MDLKDIEGANIFIVDDNEEVLEALELYLSDYKMNVTKMRSGEELLEEIKRQIPDMILLDIVMPGINGYETCIKLQHNQSTRNIPIIFMSTLNQSIDKVKAFNLGAVDYITKPLATDEFLSRINTHLSINILQRKLYDLNKELEDKVKNRTEDLERTNKQLRDEIAARVIVEEKLKTELNDKKALIQELFHRTNNNMQIITSMLNIKSLNYTKMNFPAGHDYVKKSFKSIKHKIKAMSLVHLKLYQANDLSQINLKDYINDLVTLLMINRMNKTHEIEVDLKLSETFTLIDIAVPIGLVLNELISNVFEHCVPKNSTCKLKVKLEECDNNILLDISDNGQDERCNIDLINSTTIGLYTAQTITENQLMGEISYKIDNGLHWSLKIPKGKHIRRV